MTPDAAHAALKARLAIQAEHRRKAAALPAIIAELAAVKRDEWGVREAVERVAVGYDTDWTTDNPDRASVAADASARVSHLLKSLLFVMSSAQGSPASHALSSEAAAHLAGFLDHFDEGLPRLALALGDLHLRSNGNDRTFLRAQNCFRSILGVRDELQSLAVLCGAGKQSAPCQGRGQ